MTDTRIYKSPHYHSSFQYHDGFRSFDTTLPVSFKICSKFEYVGHDVDHSLGRRFELWSPNSDHIPVYPGTRPSSFSMVPPLSHPRVDGSGGRFDWTLVPQHLDSSTLHHPFIMKPEFGKKHVEFQYLTSPSCWQRSLGQLSEDYITGLLHRAKELEDRRVSYLSLVPDVCHQIIGLVDSRPTSEEISRFRGLRNWEQCVSGVAYIQRLLHEKVAWLRMVEALRKNSWSFAVPPMESIPKSDPSLMGSWVNGGKAEHIQW